MATLTSWRWPGAKGRGTSPSLPRQGLFISPLFLLVLLAWPLLPGAAAFSTRGFSMTSDVARDRMQAIPLACPPESELLPCKCQLQGPEIHVKCENSVLDKVAFALEKLMKRVLRIEELHLVGNRIHVLPARVFGSLQVNKLFLINNELVGINRNAFAGLESSLQHLYITDPELFNIPFDALDNLANLRTCVLENTDITEIPRLYSLSKLEFLKIDGSRVTDIPTAAFRFMPNMKKIHIANSRLKEIKGNALEGLVYLKEVNFSNNIIDWIHPRAFRTLTTVEQLTLSGNSISDASMAVLAARELRELRIYDLSHNKITELAKGTFVDMPTVQIINLSNNLISKVEHGAFFRLPSLGKLDISGNKMNEFHADIFTESPTMEHLNVAKNNLTFVAEMIYISRALPNLRSLDISENHLTAEGFRNFGGHRKLEALKLDHNKLGKLYKGMFKELPNLRELYLSNNAIKSNFDGQIWNLPKLRVLDVSYNDLEMVDLLLLDGIPQLNDLDLSFNVINSFGEDAFLGLAYLENLNMSFNSITKMPKNVFLGLGELFELELSFNELMSLDNGMFQGLPSLQYLHMTHNQILTIERDVFQDTPNLKFLDLSSNFVQDIPKEVLSSLTSLIVLKLRQNVINEIKEGYLSGLRIIEHLDLSKNHIQVMSQNAFRDMSVLRDLDLSVNFIQNLHPDMFSSTKLLEKLNISHNYISDLGQSTFSHSKRLRILDITNNSLTELGNEVQGLLSLQGLFMSHNYISSLRNSTFRDLPNLSVLKFDNNGLQTFEPGTFYEMEALVYLDLQNNSLVELNPDSFRALPALKELQISKNQISVVKDFVFTDLPSLRSLELQDNVITEMGDHAFQNMPSLNFLNLSRNGLQNVPSDALARLPSLDVLDLSWNYILEITDSSLHRLEWLTVLMLHDNDLCRLSNGAFAKQRALRVLTLNNNQLRRLHLQALGNTITGLSLLDMSGNPFRCDCDLVWLKEYLNEDPDDYRVPRTAILGESLRGVPVCSAPSEYEGMRITEVPVEAFMCESQSRPGEDDDACSPRFLDPLLFTAGHQAGGALDPGAVNTLLHLTNLSHTIPQGATGPSYLDVNNPILVHNLHGLNLPPTSKPDTTTAAKPLVTAGVVQNVAEAELPSPSQSEEQLVSPSLVHTVTGDTPTIYAGSNAGSHVEDIKQQDQVVSDTGLFSGIKLPTLPNIIESISNLNLPHLGLNVNWASLPTIGRQESGAVGEFTSPSEDKPMKGPDENKPIWIDGPASPNPLFPAPPPPSSQDSPPPTLARGPAVAANPQTIIGLIPPAPQKPEVNQRPFRVPTQSLSFPSGQGERLHPGIPGTVIPVGRPTNVWRMKPKPGQVQAVRPSQGGTQQVKPNHTHRQRPNQAQGSFHPQNPTSKPVLPPVMHNGPGPNSGIPFLPGLSANQHTNNHPVQPIIVNHGSSDAQLNPSDSLRPPLPTPNRTPLSTPNRPPLPTPNRPSNAPTSLTPSNVVPGGRGTTWGGPQWSPPEVINPNSGVSLYQPGEPFQPYQPDDPNHPITVVDAPNISVAHRGTPTTPPTISSTRSNGISMPNSTPMGPTDMAPSESQVIGGANLLPGFQRGTEENKPPSQFSTQTESDQLSTVTQRAFSIVAENDEDDHQNNFANNKKDQERGNDTIFDDKQANHNPVSQSTSAPPSNTFEEHSSTDIKDPDKPKTTLGDLLDLLYAAEDEVQKESQESSNGEITSPDTSQVPQSTSQSPPFFSTASSTSSSFPVGPELPPIFSSTTEMLPVTSFLTTTLSSAATDFIHATTESSVPHTTTQNHESKLDPPPDESLPQLGDGVTVMKELPPDAFSKAYPNLSEEVPFTNLPTGNARRPTDSQQEHYSPFSDDINDSYHSPSDHPNQEGDWPFSSERDTLDSTRPTRYRPGFVLPVDKSGDPLPGVRTRPNNTYISPSKSIGRGGFPTIERIELPSHRDKSIDKNAVPQGGDVSQNGDRSSAEFSHEQAIPHAEFDTNDVNAIDWYYSNYFREYDPYASLPVGGNKPENSASVSYLSYSVSLGCLICLWFASMSN